jgi:hypothetical protein
MTDPFLEATYKIIDILEPVKIQKNLIFLVLTPSKSFFSLADHFPEALRNSWFFK